MAFKGGPIPTKLGKGNDGFSKVEAFKATFSSDTEGTVQVGREETVGMEQTASGGRGKGSK